MHDFGMGYYGMGTPLWVPAFGAGLIVLLLWSIVWKGLALWRAAQRGEKIWFVVFLFLNTAGILEIIYLFLITGAKLSDFSMSEHKHTHHESDHRHHA